MSNILDTEAEELWKLVVNTYNKEQALTLIKDVLKVPSVPQLGRRLIFP